MKSAIRLTAFFALSLALQDTALAAESSYGNSADYQFRLSFGKGSEEYFARCSGIGSSNEVVEHKMLVDRGRTEIVRKIPGRLKFNDIVCVRDIQPQKASSIWSWRREVEKGGADKARLNASITLVSAERGELAQWNIESAWPSSLSVSHENPLQEVLVLTVEGLSLNP
ncbi:phage tail protein [Methylococcus sp. EFPC2]|uniref:phage tail protein n=1 Tax=Methylococcus sp. EFPC2 TaxID=2812648 RepID=UPI0019674DAA|nr:phage tail protein [Methylococcus sp. EFPC2]QSA95845.1 phage tail protein [Methylococcus sp. EFPC2]